MAAPPVDRLPPGYQRLCRGMDGSLWLAGDHLFVIVSSGFSEEYRRVALRDIQGIFLTLDARRALCAIGWIALAAISGLVVLAHLMSPVKPRISWVFLGLGVAGIFWNQVLGQGCRSYLVTEVQTLRLPGFARTPRGRQVLRQLEAAIREAQKEPAP